eukprot:scaffold39_cov66-Phaeocystis_antarctica.AAC.7
MEWLDRIPARDPGLLRHRPNDCTGCHGVEAGLGQRSATAAPAPRRKGGSDGSPICASASSWSNPPGSGPSWGASKRERIWANTAPVCRTEEKACMTASVDRAPSSCKSARRCNQRFSLLLSWL